jgi:hypothetical protein
MGADRALAVHAERCRPTVHVDFRQAILRDIDEGPEAPDVVASAAT